MLRRGLFLRAFCGDLPDIEVPFVRIVGLLRDCVLTRFGFISTLIAVPAYRLCDSALTGQLVCLHYNSAAVIT
jgi:hypothetical protein